MGRTESLNLKNDYERACGWYGHFNKSEMALFSECTDRYAQNMLDTADIVREAMFVRRDSAVKLVDDLAGESPVSADYPVGAVVISGDGTGDQAVGSLDVNALEGWT